MSEIASAIRMLACALPVSIIVAAVLIGAALDEIRKRMK